MKVVSLITGFLLSYYTTKVTQNGSPEIMNAINSKIYCVINSTIIKTIKFLKYV